MNIMPISAVGPYRTGSIKGYSAKKISEILGFEPNVQDDPDKVSHSWGFLADGRQCGIWSYKGSEMALIFSTYGPQEVFDQLFPNKD
jgi:hypothetical protein